MKNQSSTENSRKMLPKFALPILFAIFFSHAYAIVIAVKNAKAVLSNLLHFYCITTYKHFIVRLSKILMTTPRGMGKHMQHKICRKFKIFLEY